MADRNVEGFDPDLQDWEGPERPVFRTAEITATLDTIKPCGPAGESKEHLELNIQANRAGWQKLAMECLSLAHASPEALKSGFHIHLEDLSGFHKAEWPASVVMRVVRTNELRELRRKHGRCIWCDGNLIAQNSYAPDVAESNQRSRRTAFLLQEDSRLVRNSILRPQRLTRTQDQTRMASPHRQDQLYLNYARERRKPPGLDELCPQCRHAAVVSGIFVFVVLASVVFSIWPTFMRPPKSVMHTPQAAVEFVLCVAAAILLIHLGKRLCEISIERARKALKLCIVAMMVLMLVALLARSDSPRQRRRVILEFLFIF